jgi:hypothetical protein
MEFWCRRYTHSIHRFLLDLVVLVVVVCGLIRVRPPLLAAEATAALAAGELEVCVPTFFLLCIKIAL